MEDQEYDRILDYDVAGYLHAHGLSADVQAQVTCAISPLQIEGTINGTPFYFRERWDRWRCTIGAEPVVPKANANFTWSGDWDLSIKQACDVLVAVFTEYLKSIEEKS